MTTKLYTDPGWEGYKLYFVKLECKIQILLLEIAAMQSTGK